MSELIDLVDDQGIIVRPRVLRDDAAYYEGLYMPIVIVVVMNSYGQILVHKRAETKRVHGGAIDHICGAIVSGETPEAAAHREALQETGVRLSDLTLIRQGVNSYGRYCRLIRARSDDTPAGNLNPREVAWAAFHTTTDLYSWRAAGESFVHGFFEDLNYALTTR